MFRKNLKNNILEISTSIDRIDDAILYTRQFFTYTFPITTFVQKLTSSVLFVINMTFSNDLMTNL